VGEVEEPFLLPPAEEAEARPSPRRRRRRRRKRRFVARLNLHTLLVTHRV